MRQPAAEARGADGGADEARSPSRSFYRLQKSTNPHIGPSSRDFSGGAQTARDICLQKSTKIYMRTCAREFRRGRPSARSKAARNGPAPEKERRFGAFSPPRFRPFSGPVLLSVRPRSDRGLDRASDSGPFPAHIQPDPDSVGQHPTCDRSRFPAVRLPRRRFRDARSVKSLDRASASPILGCRSCRPYRCPIRFAASSAPTPDRIGFPARPARFDPILPIRPSNIIGKYISMRF